MKIHLNFGDAFWSFQTENIVDMGSHFGYMNYFNNLLEFFVLAEVFSVFKLILQSLHSIHCPKPFFCFDEAMHLTLNSMNIIIMLRSVFCEAIYCLFRRIFCIFRKQFRQSIVFGFHYHSFNPSTVSIYVKSGVFRVCCFLFGTDFQ